MIRIENWKVGSSGDGFTPPEMSSPLLKGEVYGHPRFENGDDITTSRIVAVDGRKVTTYSGSVYELGDPDPAYVEWCEEQGYTWNDEQPIRFVG